MVRMHLILCVPELVHRYLVHLYQSAEKRRQISDAQNRRTGHSGRPSSAGKYTRHLAVGSIKHLSTMTHGADAPDIVCTRLGTPVSGASVPIRGEAPPNQQCTNRRTDHSGRPGSAGRYTRHLIRAYQYWYASYQVPVHPAME